MSNYPEIPLDLTPVVLTPPVTTNGGVTTDYISLKNAHAVYIVATFTQAVSHQTGIDPTQATAVAGTGVKAITNTCKIWTNTDISSASTLTQQTDAITVNCAAGATNQILIMKIEPAALDVANSFDCLGMTVDDSSQATNFVSIVAYVVPRYSPAADMIID